MNVTALHRCPRCHSTLQLDRIGGIGRGAAQPPRVVWLCTTCWCVYPDSPEQPQPVHLEEERRRDLA